MPPAPRALKFRGVGAPFALRTAQQLQFSVEKLTLRAARKGPTIIELYVPDSGWLRMGIGLSKSVLSFRPAEEAAKGKNGLKHCVSLANNGGSDDIVYWTWCDHDRHGYERRNLIDMKVANAAFELFFQTGELSPDVKWEVFKPGAA